MVAGTARQRIETQKFIHLHSGTGAVVSRSRHIGVVSAAEVVSLGQDGVAAQTSSPIVILLGVTRSLVKTRLILSVVKPVDMKEHSHKTALQILRHASWLAVSYM